MLQIMDLLCLYHLTLHQNSLKMDNCQLRCFKTASLSGIGNSIHNVDMESFQSKENENYSILQYGRGALYANLFHLEFQGNIQFIEKQ